MIVVIMSIVRREIVNSIPSEVIGGSISDLEAHIDEFWKSSREIYLKIGFAFVPLSVSRIHALRSFASQARTLKQTDASI
jgi:hypothetical protein